DFFAGGVLRRRHGDAVQNRRPFETVALEQIARSNLSLESGHLFGGRAQDLDLGVERRVQCRQETHVSQPERESGRRKNDERGQRPLDRFGDHQHTPWGKELKKYLLKTNAWTAFREATQIWAAI